MRFSKSLRCASACISSGAGIKQARDDSLFRIVGAAKNQEKGGGAKKTSDANMAQPWLAPAAAPGHKGRKKITGKKKSWREGSQWLGDPLFRLKTGFGQGFVSDEGGKAG